MTLIASNHFDFLIGLVESAAFEFVQEHGFTPRIVARDGNHFICTQDYRTDRVNLTVVDNKVTRWTIG